PPDDSENADDDDHEIEAMEPASQRVVLIPLLAELLTHVRKTQAPRERTKKCVGNEPGQVHSCHARRKGDKRSDDRQEPAGKYNQLAVFCEPTIREIKIATRDQNVAAVLLDQRPPAIHAYPIGHERSD